MNLNLITREQWGARPAERFATIPVPTPKLVLHHSAGSGTDAKAVRAIQDFHMDIRGWSDIAYSFLVDDDEEYDEDVFEGRGFGIAGGHTKGYNTVAHAICIIGDFSNKAPRESTIKQVIELVRLGHSLGMWPDQFTEGHRDLGTTQCPGDVLYSMIPEINRRIRVANQKTSNPGFQDAFDRALARGIFTKHTDVADVVTSEKFAEFLKRAGLLDGATTVDAVARQLAKTADIKVDDLRGKLRQV